MSEPHSSSVHRLLQIFLVAVTLCAAVDAYLEAHRIPEPTWWWVGSTAFAGILVPAWYYQDSESIAFRRSRWLNFAVVGAAILAIPYYVIKSRKPGQKLRAFMNLAGFFALCLLCDSLGDYVGGLIHYP